MLEFLYPAKIEEEDGFFTITFRDIPFALTDGKTYEEALQEAVDCFGEALTSCIVDNEDIPMPSPARPGEILITPPALVAAKAALYIATNVRCMNPFFIIRNKTPQFHQPDTRVYFA